MTLPILYNGAHAPRYQTEGSIGADLIATDSKIIWPWGVHKVETSLAVQLPDGYSAEIRPRSGMALHRGLVAIFGTIDSDYRGPVGVLLQNTGILPRIVRKGERVAQFVLQYNPRAVFLFEPTLSKTKRGAGGFGSTGQ